MDSIIKIKELSKVFKILNKREGLLGGMLDLFSRNYNTVKAVNKINIEVNQGEIVAYLGVNGSGKSTTIKMMTGILIPTEGTIFVNGKVPYINRSENCANIGVVFGQRTGLWWALPFIESLKILKDMYNINDNIYNNNLKYFENIVDIKSLYSKPIRNMSLGQRTLCDILAAFLHDPKIVFLDEPTIGLDIVAKSKIREIIKDINQKKKTTIILTTHDISDVDALCRRVIIIDKGSLIFDGDMESLHQIYGDCKVLKIKYVADQDSWSNIVLDEKVESPIEIIRKLNEENPISDFVFQKIDTESVIKKIYGSI